MKKIHLHKAWLILAAYGVWFAIFSGLEEAVAGKVWKIGLSLILGAVAYLIIRKSEK